MLSRVTSEEARKQQHMEEKNLVDAYVECNSKYALFEVCSKRNFFRNTTVKKYIHLTATE